MRSIATILLLALCILAASLVHADDGTISISGSGSVSGTSTPSNGGDDGSSGSSPSTPPSGGSGTASSGSNGSGGDDGVEIGGGPIASNNTDADDDPSLSVCSPACATTEVCRFNTCVVRRPILACKLRCAVEYGERCDTETGMCVTAPKPTCEKCSGLCVRAAFPGRRPVCITPGGPSAGGNGSSNAGNGTAPVSFQTCTKMADCGGLATGNICLFGRCSTCGPLCKALAEDLTLTPEQKVALLAAITQSGMPLLTYKYIRNVVLLDLAANGTISLPYNGTILRLENAIIKDKLKHLKLEHDSSAASIEAGESVQVPLLTSSATNGQLLVGDSATLSVDNLVVDSSADVTVVLSKAATRSMVTVGSLDLGGQLNIAGDSTTTVSFPSDKRASVKVRDGGQVNVGGGVGLDGDAEDAPLRIVTSTGTTVSIANILRNASFHHSGPIDGDAGSVLGIQGQFDYNGTSISPELQISTGAVVHLEVDDGKEVRAGDLSFPHLSNNGGKNFTIFQINATSSASGKGLLFGLLKNCPAEVVIRYHIKGAAKRAAALAAGVTLMTYAKASVTLRATFSCAVQVCDDDGCTDVSSSASPSGRRRRLLRASSKATSMKTATFGETQLTVQGDGMDGGDGVSAATSVSAVSALFVSVIAALFAMMM